MKNEFRDESGLDEGINIGEMNGGMHAWRDEWKGRNKCRGGQRDE